MVTELAKNKEIEQKIQLCLSTSLIAGKELRLAHYFLGSQLGNQMITNESLNNMKIAVVIMMRAGLPFGLGVSDSLEHCNDVDIFFMPCEQICFHNYDMVIIADAVINTGKTILDFINSNHLPKIIIATNVISESHVQNFNSFNVQAVRISKNSYKGTMNKTIFNGKGPDTGDRLFCNSFFSK